MKLGNAQLSRQWNNSFLIKAFFRDHLNSRIKCISFLAFYSKGHSNLEKNVMYLFLSICFQLQIGQGLCGYGQIVQHIWAKFFWIWASLVRCFGQIYNSLNWLGQIHIYQILRGNTDHYLCKLFCRSNL